MREPWATIFWGYDEHWLLGQYLMGPEPDWEGIKLEPRLGDLSTGEKVLIYVADQFRGPFHQLDKAHRTRIAMALLDLP